MEFVELNLNRFEALYNGEMQDDFPAAELKPWSLLKKQYDRGLCKAFELCDFGVRKAYVVFEIPQSGNVWLVDYFAVLKAERGSGFGGMALKTIKNNVPADAVMFEIERPDEAADEADLSVRTRRKRFYLKNGVVETGVTSVADGGIGYEILCMPIKKYAVGEAAEQAMLAIYRTLFKEGEYSVKTANLAVQTAEVVAALIWRGDRFMICRRPKNKARGLLWEFVGGKVEFGESKEQALVRECIEELDVEVVPKGVFAEVGHVYPDIRINLTLFNAEIKHGEPKMLEHSDIKWILPSEIDEYEFCPADKEILEKIKKMK